MNLHVILMLSMSTILAELGLASCARGRFRLNIQHLSQHEIIAIESFVIRGTFLIVNNNNVFMEK